LDDQYFRQRNVFKWKNMKTFYNKKPSEIAQSKAETPCFIGCYSVTAGSNQA